jgi:tripartite ATP-independent transporter DctM subunit
MTETLVAFAVLLALAFARMPIAFAMLIVGGAGFALKRGWPAAFDQVAQTTFAAGIDYELSVVPLFILMGNFVARAGMSQELFRAAYTFIGHWKGGLAMSTIVACAGFGSICGSSIATAATMSRVAYPPMKKLGYSDKLASASIAAGGTLGILIPPSTIMVIYGIITETNIGRLFAAGVLPGILAVALLWSLEEWQWLASPGKA